MTYFWVDQAGKIKRATSVIPDPLPDYLEGCTPLDSDEVGAPVDGRQTWDGKQWSAPPPPRLTRAERLERLETVLKAKGVITDADLER